MAFPARCPGHCEACSERIREGDMIRYGSPTSGDRRIIHDDCDQYQSAPRREHPVCPVCWLVHPEGTCDR